MQDKKQHLLTKPFLISPNSKGGLVGSKIFSIYCLDIWKILSIVVKYFLNNYKFLTISFLLHLGLSCIYHLVHIYIAYC